MSIETIPYKFEASPHVLLPSSIVNSGQTIEDGANCQTVMHLIYEERFGLQLSRGLWSKEVYEDEGEFFVTIPLECSWQVGDVGLFGSRSLKNPKKLHIATCTNSAPLLTHTTNGVGVVEWKLRDFFSLSKYEVLYRRKRLKPDYYDSSILPNLNQLET